MKKQERIVTEVGKLAEDVYSLTIHAPDIASEAVPGQFVSVFTRDEAHLLPRPISICDTDEINGEVRLVYRVVGFGTREFSRFVPGNRVSVMGPLGNGFPIGDIQGDKGIKENLKEDNSGQKEKQDKKENEENLAKKIVLIGGGIGIPPMLFAAKRLSKSTGQNKDNSSDQNSDITVTAVLGYRERHTFLSDEFEKAADKVLIATDDGSIGAHGTVIDALEENGVSADIVFACGPTPMLRGVKQWAAEREIPAYLSFEEKMACGIGACLACVCHTTALDGHSKVNNARICKDGPVFLASEIEI